MLVFVNEESNCTGKNWGWRFFVPISFFPRIVFWSCETRNCSVCRWCLSQQKTIPTGWNLWLNGNYRTQLASVRFHGCDLASVKRFTTLVGTVLCHWITNAKLQKKMFRSKHDMRPINKLCEIFYFSAACHTLKPIHLFFELHSSVDQINHTHCPIFASSPLVWLNMPGYSASVDCNAGLYALKSCV